MQIPLINTHLLICKYFVHLSVGNATKGFATYGCFHPCLFLFLFKIQIWRTFILTFCGINLSVKFFSLFLSGILLGNFTLKLWILLTKFISFEVWLYVTSRKGLGGGGSRIRNQSHNILLVAWKKTWNGLFLKAYLLPNEAILTLLMR